MERTLRHERKYLINAGTYELLRRRFAAVMPLDSHSKDGGYRITSVYYDDAYRSAYNDKMLGLNRRKKFRIRTYNLDKSRIQLECKFKDDDFISKKSAILTPAQYESLLKGDCSFGNAPEFEDTVMTDFVFSDAVSRLRPSVVVDYYREAYVNHAGNVRFTFDKKLSTVYNTVDMFAKNAAYTPVIDGIILELKYDEFLPSYIGDVLSGLPLMSEACSKFTLCTDKLVTYKHYCYSQI